VKQIFAVKLLKNIHLKNHFLCLLIFCCFFYCTTVSAQDCLAEIFNNKLYSNANDIINGKKWINEKKYRGSPLLIENYWPKADILYNGSYYTGIQMNYDVYKNEIIIFHSEKDKEKYVVLINDYLSGFSFTDTITNQKHIYEYIELKGISGKALYENASVGKTSFYIKPMKVIEAEPTGKGQGKFAGFYKYFLDTGNGYTGFSSKSQFLKLLANHETEIKRFLRRNRLKINSSQPENIVAVIKYLNELN
jgi:hypothetical protein